MLCVHIIWSIALQSCSTVDVYIVKMVININLTTEIDQHLFSMYVIKFECSYIDEKAIFQLFYRFPTDTLIIVIREFGTRCRYIIMETRF